MRTNKKCKIVSLKDELIDILIDWIPQSDEIESFYNSPDWDKMIDSILMVIEEHVADNVDLKRLVE